MQRISRSGYQFEIVIRHHYRVRKRTLDLIRQASKATILGIPDRALTHSLCRQKSARIIIALVSLSKIHQLNLKFRGLDTPTDVLSFSRMPIPDYPSVPTTATDAGDIVLSLSYIKAQAKRVGVSFSHEVVLMVIHGILHLFGYDHIVKKDKTKMFNLQNSILKRVMRP